MRKVRTGLLRSHFIPVLLFLLASGCSSVGVASDDAQALEDLGEAGSDLSKVHPFDFYIYHPDSDGAESICADLAGQGFQTDTREAAAGGDWLCLASVEMLPTLENLSQLEGVFEELTTKYGGEYDGWQTVVIP